MLKSVTFIKEHRCFKVGDTVDFLDGITLLVGEQGCGKSTLLRLLANDGGEKRAEVVKTSVTEEVRKNSVRTKYFDCEKHNPRTADMNATRDNDVYAYSLISRFKSHGESILPILGHIAKEKERHIFFIDEPDMAMSVRSIEKIKKVFAKAVKSGHQIIASAHNPFMILGFKEVYSLEHRKVMSSVEFVESHLGKNLGKIIPLKLLDLIKAL